MYTMNSDKLKPLNTPTILNFYLIFMVNIFKSMFFNDFEMENILLLIGLTPMDKRTP
jgi:hypothetical protein